MRWRLLALDYDRTLTEPGERPRPEVLQALAVARAGGLRVVLCSGQPLAALRAAVPDADGYAAENGCVRWCAGEAWTHPWPHREGLRREVLALGIAVEAFEVILSMPRAAAGRGDLAPLVAAHGAVAVPNVDALNLLPAGESKGTGLAWLRERLGVPRAACVAVGDGENDVAMFREAGLAVAVANATPAARAAAHLVLAEEDGAGVRALLARLAAGEVQAPA